MRSLLSRAYARVLIFALISASFWVPNRASAETPPAPVVELGTLFNSGDTEGSLTGSTSYFVLFRAEETKGFFRWSMAYQLEFSAGDASFTEGVSGYTLYGAAFEAGMHLYPFNEGRFQPFFGGAPVLGWHILQLSAPPGSLEANTKSLAFGYEVDAGVDMRLGGSKGNAFRIRGGFWSLSSSLGGASGFSLEGFRLSVGIVY